VLAAFGFFAVCAGMVALALWLDGRDEDEDVG
jgi:hypothetical protein